jgi:hypothetical protein
LEKEKVDNNLEDVNNEKMDKNIIVFKDNQVDKKFKFNSERTILINDNKNLEKLLNENSLDLKKQDINIRTLNINDNDIINLSDK